MEILFVLIPLTLLLLVCAGMAFFWALKRGQFDDLQNCGQHILQTDHVLAGDENPAADSPHSLKGDASLRTSVDTEAHAFVPRPRR